MFSAETDVAKGNQVGEEPNDHVLVFLCYQFQYPVSNYEFDLKGKCLETRSQQPAVILVIWYIFNGCAAPGDLAARLNDTLAALSGECVKLSGTVVS